MSDGMVSSLLPSVSPTGLDRGQSSQEYFIVFIQITCSRSSERRKQAVGSTITSMVSLVIVMMGGLKEMMKTIEEYCSYHNLKFSTDPNPSKCKTKCFAFLHKDRPLPNVIMGGNSLPWVKEGVHLGNHFGNNYNGMKKDILVKRATFIGKNCELLQEFAYATPSTVLKLNEIYNLHFTGSPIWDLFCPEALQLEKTWNISIRKIFNLPLQTHKYFIEPISGKNHLKKILIKRFLSFLKQVQNLEKKHSEAAS